MTITKNLTGSVARLDSLEAFSSSAVFGGGGFDCPVSGQLDLGGMRVLDPLKLDVFPGEAFSLELRKKLIRLVTSRDFLVQCAKQDLKDLRQSAGKMIAMRYMRSRVPKYGALGAKAMSLEDVDKFFAAFLPEEYRYKTLFMIQAMLGLRIGEVVKINKRDLDFKFKQVAIHSEKKRFEQVDQLPMHEKLEHVLREYLHTYTLGIDAHDGYLFFPSQSNCATPYVSAPFAQKVFSRVRDRAGLDRVYAERVGISGRNFQRGKLHSYSTHSLRHTFARFLAKRNVPIEIAKHMLRHSDISSTQIYFVPDKADVEKKWREVFDPRP